MCGRSVDSPIRLPAGVWVVIAAFNEEARIGTVLSDVLAVAQHVVVVDDGSSDQTAAVVRGTGGWLLTHPVNLGQGAALQTGITFALHRGATHIVTFDADGQHRAEDIPQLVNALGVNAADFALGSRFLGRAEGIPRARRLMLHMAVAFTRLVSRVNVSDTHNGIRAMTRKGAERIHITFNRMEHASEIVDQIARSGLAYVEVPVHIRYTAASLLKGQRASSAVGLGIRVLLNKLTQ